MIPDRDPSSPRGRPDWTEDRVEKLLERFFRRELPPALRLPGLPEPIVASTMETAAGRSRTAGRWLLPLCVAGLAACVWILQPSPSNVFPTAAGYGAAATVEFESTSWPVSSEQVTIAGLHGAFEQRSELRWTSQSYFEPEAGVWVEWSAPELVIDVEAVDEGELQ